MEVDFVTKLGGSAVTQKDKFETLKKDDLRDVAKVLAKCHRQGQRFVVVHGAGSFGHHQAREYGVNHGYSNSDETKELVKEGFCQTRLSVCKLNHFVVEALVNEGIPAVAVSPCSSWITDRGVVVQDGVESVARLLGEGYIPCLHGDCVLDQSQGCRILSGDTIIQVLCKSLRTNRVVFLTDVQGIYDKPPTFPDAKLITQIGVNSDLTLDVSMETDTSDQNDVTGGIRLKLDSAINIVAEHKGDIPVFICGTGLEAYHNACMHGDYRKSKGTVVKYHVQ